MEIREGDLEDIISTLKEIHTDPAMEDVDDVVDKAMKVKLTRRELSELAHEYDQQQLHNKMAQKNKK